MSTAVTRRLAELARQGEARRRRMQEIRQESFLALEKARSPRWEQVHGEVAVRSQGRELASGDLPREDGSDLAGEDAPIPSGDILDQVQSLMQEVDIREKDQWTDDDALILVCLEEACAAAKRRGYTLEELQTVLRAFPPPV